MSTRVECRSPTDDKAVVACACFGFTLFSVLWVLAKELAVGVRSLDDVLLLVPPLAAAPTIAPGLDLEAPATSLTLVGPVNDETLELEVVLVPPELLPLLPVLELAIVVLELVRVRVVEVVEERGDINLEELILPFELAKVLLLDLRLVESIASCLEEFATVTAGTDGLSVFADFCRPKGPSFLATFVGGAGATFFGIEGGGPVLPPFPTVATGIAVFFAPTPFHTLCTAVFAEFKNPNLDDVVCFPSGYPPQISTIVDISE